MLSCTPCNVLGHWFIGFYTDNYFPGLVHLLPKSCLAYYLGFELKAVHPYNLLPEKVGSLIVEKMAQRPRLSEIQIQSLSDLSEGVEEPELLR